MRFVIFKDKKISKEEYDAHLQKLKDFYVKWLDVTPDFWVIEKDFSDYQYELDIDGDVRPGKTLLRDLLGEVRRKYEQDGTDYVRIHIHEDHWKSSGPLFDKIRSIYGFPPKKGIWGTAFAYHIQPYLTTYCRFDRDNQYNSFNTAYHEDLHPWDSLVATELGVNLNTVVQKWLRTQYENNAAVISHLDAKGFNWDRDMVHGGLAPVFDYIGRAGASSNELILPVVAPYVRAALQKREQRHQERIRGLHFTIFALVEQVLYLLRSRINKKDGVVV